MVRSKIGIETLINLLTICYAEMSLLPFPEDDFAMLKNVSPQQVRFLLGREITKQIFFSPLPDLATKENLPDSLIQRIQFALFAKSTV